MYDCFFFNDTATTEIYTLSLHDALPIFFRSTTGGHQFEPISPDLTRGDPETLGPSGGPITKDNVSTEYYGTIFAFAESPLDRKSTRLNSSHANISYAVFCLKKQKRRTDN